MADHHVVTLVWVVVLLILITLAGVAIYDISQSRRWKFHLDLKAYRDTTKEQIEALQAETDALRHDVQTLQHQNDLLKFEIEEDQR